MYKKTNIKKPNALLLEVSTISLGFFFNILFGCSIDVNLVTYKKHTKPDFDIERLVIDVQTRK